MAMFRWVGSKAGVAEVIAAGLYAALPSCQGSGRVVSPFYGTGAIEREALGSGMFEGILAYDACDELRCFYTAVRRSPRQVLVALRLLCAQPGVFTKDGYLRLRAQNGRGQEIGAARFLYLQAYSFRGIWRVNRVGRHNTPSDQGRLDGYRFDLEDGGELEQELLTLSKVLRGKLEWATTWASCVAASRPGDLILADPPYLETFGGYSSAPFLRADQEALALQLKYLSTLGRRVLAFNSPAAAPLYKGWATRVDMSRASRMVSATGLREWDCVFLAGFTKAEQVLFLAAARPKSTPNKAPVATVVEVA
jgi:DNA adenine methylase